MEDVQFDEGGLSNDMTTKHTSKPKATKKFLGVTVSQINYYALNLLILVFVLLLVVFVYLLILNSRLRQGPAEIQHYLQVDQRLYRSDYQTNPIS